MLDVKNPSAFHLSILIWERTSNQRRKSNTRSLQRVNHREQTKDFVKFKGEALKIIRKMFCLKSLKLFK